jgi:shikimate kinase/shikimate kinase/3-dehydroquinate synthase
MMGVGKSTLGKLVAKKLNLNFIDTDICVEKNCLMKISEIFKIKGEKYFRLEEEKEVSKAIKKNKSVIALGGGAFLTKTVRNNILKNCISIWLNLDTKSLNRRIKWYKKRPLLNKDKKSKIISKLNTERANIYKLANYKIDCNKLSKENIVKKIISIYEEH